MVGVIQCPVNDIVVSTYKDKFRQLGAFKSDDAGVVYLRGTDPIGCITIQSSRDNDKRWVRRPELDIKAMEKHCVDTDKMLRKMYTDAYELCNASNVDLDLDDTNNDPYIKALDGLSDIYKSAGNGRYSAVNKDEDVYTESGDSSNNVIMESSEAISAAWSPACLDGYSISRLQNALQDFYVSNRKTIMSLYDYADTRGRYVSLKSRCMYRDVLKKYTEYFNDFVTFSEAVASSKDINVKADEREEKVLKATDADTKFRESLFVPEETVMFPAAVSDLGVMIDLNSFLTQVRDRFIQFEGFAKDDKISAAVINVFGFSVTQFLSRFINSFVTDYKKLVEASSGKYIPTEKDKIDDALLL